MTRNSRIVTVGIVSIMLCAGFLGTPASAEPSAQGLTSAATPADPAALYDRTTRVSMNSTWSLASGSWATVNGRLTDQYHNGQTYHWLILERRSIGASRWEHVKTFRTSTNGNYQTKFQVWISSEIRVRYPGGQSNGVRFRPSTSPVRTIFATQWISANHLPRIMVAGEAITVRGQASAGLRGAQVRLQRLIPGVDTNWVTVGGTIASRTDGRYQLSWNGAVMGKDQRYRILAGFVIGPGIKWTERAVDTRTVYGWIELGKIKAISSNNVDLVDSIRIDDTDYRHSIVHSKWRPWSVSLVTYSLARRCIKFHAVAGKTTLAGIGFGSFSVNVDGIQILDVKAAKGLPYNIDQPLPGTALELTLSTSNTDDSDSAQNAWGTPKVLCYENPNPR